jgi:hypothetical protein
MSRLETFTYPNGQSSSYVYYPNSGDHRLQEIHHKKSGGDALEFSYTYDAVRNIAAWTQQQDANPAKAYDFRIPGGPTSNRRVEDDRYFPTILKRYAYTTTGGKPNGRADRQHPGRFRLRQRTAFRASRREERALRRDAQRGGDGDHQELRPW